MAEQPLQSLIGHNHRRVLSVRMRLLEEYSLRLMELFEPLEAELTSRAPLSKGTAEQMEREIAALQSRIHEMKTELGLEPSVAFTRGTLWHPPRGCGAGLNHDHLRRRTPPPLSQRIRVHA